MKQHKQKEDDFLSEEDRYNHYMLDICSGCIELLIVLVIGIILVVVIV